MRLPRALQKPGPWWFAVVVWLVVMFIASSQATYLPPALFSFQDKVEHATFFAAGGLCFFLALRLQPEPMNFVKLAIITILFCSIIGASDEWHQTFTPGRSGNDVWDWTADTVGGLIAVVLGRWVKW